MKLRKRGKRVFAGKQEKYRQLRESLLDQNQLVEGGLEELFPGGGQKQERSCCSSCCYYITCGLCGEAEDPYIDAVKTLFNLCDQSSEQEMEKLYFTKNSLSQFKDLMHQLDMVTKSDDQNNQELNLSKDAKYKDIYEMFEEQRKKITVENLTSLHQFREKMADVFCLADKDNDKVLYNVRNELKEFWEIIDEEIELIKDQGKKDKAKEWKDEKFQNSKKAQYHEIQKIVWEGLIKYEFDVNRIQNRFYKKRVKCVPLFTCCCCKNVRWFFTKSRMKPKDPESIHFGIKKVISTVYSQIHHGLDLFTDINLAWALYDLSRQELQGDFETNWLNQKNLELNNYNYCFIWVAMAIFGPYIIQYSAMNSSVHNKGFFKKDKWSKLSCLRQTYLILSLTALGLIIMPIIDILLKIKAMINAFCAIFLVCNCGNEKTIGRRIHESFELGFEYCFKLNMFELENFEKQKKYTQVLFEDIPMLLLQLLIITGCLIVPEITHPTLNKQNLTRNAFLYSFLSTIISIITTYIQLVAESNGLKESKLEYTMLSMKAKQDWVPFGNNIMHGTMKQDIDYSMIEFKIPILTDVSGFYMGFIYMFSEESLIKLTSYLDFAYSKKLLQQQQQGQQNNFEPKLKFGFSLFTITIHDFCRFIDRNFYRDQSFVWDKLDLNDINWEQLIENSRLKYGEFVDQIDEEKSLLQICIENENTVSEQWQLKELMKLLIKENKDSVNSLIDQEQYTLLTYCYNNQKHQAFKLLIEEFSDHIDINKENKDGSTIYGLLFYNNTLPHFRDNNYDPTEKLQLILDKFGSKIDRNVPQIRIANQVLWTPIYYYLKNIRKGVGMTMSEMFQSPEFKKYFGQNEHYLKDPLEIQQVFLLLFEAKTTANIAKKFLNEKKAILQNQNSDYLLEEYLSMQDKDANNFMDLVECKFASQFWKPYVLNEDEEILKKMARQQLHQVDTQNKTPLMQQLERNQPNFRAISRLFQQDLIEKESISDKFEMDIAKGFLLYFINQYSNEKTRKTDLINRQKFFEAFKSSKRIYKFMRQRFELIQKQEIFEYYLKIEDFEKFVKEGSQINEENERQIQDLMKENDYIEEKIQYQINFDNKRKINASIILKKDENIKENIRTHFIVETIVNGLIEISSILDFISDLYVLYLLSHSTDTAWFSFSLFTMICPYYTVYSSLMTFKINDIRQLKESQGHQKTSCCSWVNIKSYLIIFPSILVYMIFMDILFMIISVIMYIIMFFGMCCSGRRQLYIWYQNIWNITFQSLFGMSVMDARGFKCQRTILQLQLESIPQIFFMCYLLYRIPILKKQYGSKFTISVDVQTILFSILTAFIHTIFEVINLYLEARTSETKFIDYMVACYNARQGWIPQRDKFYQSFIERMVDDRSYNILQSVVPPNKIINFDEQNKKYCGKRLGYSVQFELSDNSMDYLIQIISNLPYQHIKKKRVVLKLSACVKHVSPTSIYQLLHLANNKITIEFDEVILEEIIIKDQDMLNKVKNPNEQEQSYNEQEEHLLVDLVKLNNTQFVKILIDLGADINVTSRKKIVYKIPGINDDDANTSLFKIAYKLGNREMMMILMDKAAKIGNNQIYQTMMQSDIIFTEISKASDGQFLTQPIILLDPMLCVTWDQMNSCVFKMKDYFNKYNKQAEQLWNVVFGAFVPYIDYKKVPDFLQFCEQIQSWQSDYPQKIKLSKLEQNGDQGEITTWIELDSQFLCQFTLVRRAFYINHCNEMAENYHAFIDLTNILNKHQCNLQDIINVYKIYKKQVIENKLNREQIKRCDKIVKFMGFDKNWSQYYHVSRQILQQDGHEDIYSTYKSEAKWIQVSEKEFQRFQVLKLPQNSLAVKQIRVYRSREESNPTKILFKFQMQHYSGWITSPLPSQDFWQQSQQNEDQNTILIINHELQDYEAVDDHKFRVLNLTIKNQMRDGNNIQIHLLDDKLNILPCYFEVVTYNEL